MTIEQSFFLQVLSDFLHRRKTDVPERLDWQQLLELSKVHELSAILFFQCRDYLQASDTDPELVAALKKEYNLTIRQYVSYQNACEELFRALSDRDIPFIPVKGVLIAPHYPEPAFRTMGDVDLVIRPAYREQICALMRELGYSNPLNSEKELHFSRFAVKIEMQQELIHEHGTDGAAIYAYFAGLWDHAAPYNESSEHHLDPNSHFLYLVAHIAKHMKWIGVGLRMFYDLAVLVRETPELFDWDLISREAERIGLLRFLRLCLALNERWFGVPSPLPDSELSEELAQTVTEKVFSDGVFGFSNEENRIHKLEYHKRTSRQPIFLIKLRTFFALVFPSYKNLVSSEKYSRLRGRPWLLPAVWAGRLFKAIRSKGNWDSASAILSADGKAVEERRSFLRELGL